MTRAQSDQRCSCLIDCGLPFQDYTSNKLSKLSETGGEKVGVDPVICVDMDAAADSYWL